MKRIAPILFAIVAACAGGPDVVRYRAELADLELAQACAKAWLDQKPAAPDEQVRVARALDAWRSRLAADAQLLGLTPPAPWGGQ